MLDRPWSWLKQVHGAAVVVVEGPGDKAAATADASITAHPDAALCVLTADCAPVALAGDGGIIGAVHAGWRGLAAGVVRAAVARMRALGAGRIVGAVGPCIHPECYEFSPPDLDMVAARLGNHVRGRTGDGRPALDLPLAVRAELEGAAVDVVAEHPACTACDGGFFSHRARRETGRQATVVWLP